MNPEDILQILGELRSLKGFPNEASVMVALVRLCGSMCSSEEQVRWLVERMTSGIYQEWPGIGEVRGCFCSRFKPADGINAYSTLFPDGFPPDPTAPPRQVTGPAPKLLERGEPMTADLELQAKLEKAVVKLSMPPAVAVSTRFSEMLREIETPPHLRQEPEQPINLDFKPIDHADIARAVEELHAQREREKTSQ